MQFICQQPIQKSDFDNYSLSLRIKLQYQRAQPLERFIFDTKNCELHKKVYIFRSESSRCAGYG